MRSWLEWHQRGQTQLFQCSLTSNNWWLTLHFAVWWSTFADNTVQYRPFLTHHLWLSHLPILLVKNISFAAKRVHFHPKQKERNDASVFVNISRSAPWSVPHPPPSTSSKTNVGAGAVSTGAAPTAWPRAPYMVVLGWQHLMFSIMWLSQGEHLHGISFETTFTID